MSEPVKVQPYVVLYAIRYGLGRLTYAHQDALNLIRDHWDVLAPRWAKTIRDDLVSTRDLATDRHTRDTTEQTIAWVDEQIAAR